MAIQTMAETTVLCQVCIEDSLSNTIKGKETIMEKWTQSLDEANYQILKGIADKRKIAVPELIRAVVVPEWMEARAVMKR